MSNEAEKLTKSSAVAPVNVKLKDPAIVEPPKKNPAGTKKAQQVAARLIEDSLSDTKEAQSRLTARLNKGEVSPRAVYEACRNFEAAVGGRGALITALQHCPPNSLGFNMVRNLVADPDFLKYSEDNPQNVSFALAELCKRHKLPFNALVTAFKDAKTSEMALDALVRVSREAPSIVDDIVTEAKTRTEPCYKCDGAGRHFVIEFGEYRVDENGDRVTKLCHRCDGKGTLRVQGDLQNRKIALKLAGLDEQKPLIQQNFNQDNRSINLDFTPGKGGFEKMVSAIDTLTSGKSQPEKPVIEAEVIDAED